MEKLIYRAVDDDGDNIYFRMHEGCLQYVFYDTSDTWSNITDAPSRVYNAYEREAIQHCREQRTDSPYLVKGDL